MTQDQIISLGVTFVIQATFFAFTWGTTLQRLKNAEERGRERDGSISDLRHDLDALRMEHAARGHCSFDCAPTGHRVAE